jgi:hypothetical protein
MPPKGAISIEISPVLIPTIPASRVAAMRQMRPARAPSGSHSHNGTT